MPPEGDDAPVLGRNSCYGVNVMGEKCIFAVFRRVEGVESRGRSHCSEYRNGTSPFVLSAKRLMVDEPQRFPAFGNEIHLFFAHKRIPYAV